MAEIRSIEDLPVDDLREILIRVARQPEGAFDIARIFAVSKTFQKFSEDRDVLRAVPIMDLLPRIASGSEFYDELSEVGGLIARCARAGNPNAQFILAKIALFCASKLCHANMKADSSRDHCSCSTRPIKTYNLSDAERAERLLGHFSAHNTDPSELLDLVRNFLSRAKVRDFSEMHLHLKDFIGVYLLSEKKPQHLQFLTTLTKLCLRTIYSVESLVGQLNELCIEGYNMMRCLGMDNEVIFPIWQCQVQINDDVDEVVVSESLIARLNILERIVKAFNQAASTVDDDRQVSLIKSCISCLTKELEEHLRDLLDYYAFIQNARAELLASFDALFNIGQGSS